MLYLQATQKARDELGVGRIDLSAAGLTDARLGNWLVNIVPIAGRYAFLYASTRSLMSFPIFIGQRVPSPADMPAFLAHGIAQFLPTLGIPKSTLAALISEFDEVALCKATNKAELGVHAAIAADYFHLMDRPGQTPDIVTTIHTVNSKPRPTLGWRTAYEATRALLASSET